MASHTIFADIQRSLPPYQSHGHLMNQLKELALSQEMETISVLRECTAGINNNSQVN